ncbi:hypothetical protein [Nonomuraea endophytica]|uniref:hypothetical protein n=1 Tax=Nonomuraea endophytica TaxID=714136 RepID=UPI0037CB8C3A
MRWLEDRAEFADRCLFATAPDVVGNAFASVSRSHPFLQRIREMSYPVALVAQDYMEFCPHWDWDAFDCFFVGGSTTWKLSPAAAVLARVAATAGKWVHVGRVNSLKRLRYAAAAMDADSADGTLLTNGPDNHLPSVLTWTWRLQQEDPASLIDARDLIQDPYDGRYQLGWTSAAVAPHPRVSAPHLEQLTLL